MSWTGVDRLNRRPVVWKITARKRPKFRFIAARNFRSGAGISRWAGNLLTLASLLLFGAAVFLWVRSYRVADRWEVQRHRGGPRGRHVTDVSADCTLGTVEVIVQRGTVRSPGEDGFVAQHGSGLPFELMFQGVGSTLAERLGLRLIVEPSAFVLGMPASGATQALVNFPLWLVAALFAALPARWGVVTWRRRKREPGACTGCGYDLRATPHRCPECGRVPSSLKGRDVRSYPAGLPRDES